ncbi:lipoxygenase homology domain-containing protein 1-like [Physella acuta]|uniref:lipoxygenase homology domain-containing protein 1-like n=1 Tax=Physella acuta TaxID=109671 RepID=UPI0027DC7383|nr:lipoxygenase homology domain-containing protein 1-like [Physella acuta]
MTIFGSSGSTGRLVMPNQSAGNFEKGDTDTFTVHANNVGRVRSIEIGHNNHGWNSGWFLDYVEIVQKVAAVGDHDIRPGTTKYRFDFFNWIASDEGDRLLIKNINSNHPEVNLG